MVKLRDRVNAALVELNVVCGETIEAAEKAKASVKRNKYNNDSISIQKVVVAFVADKMGDRIYGVMDGRRVGLEKVLDEAQLLLAPTVSTATLRKWVRHFLLFGETKAETNDYKRRHHKNRNRGRKWSFDETAILRDLVEEMPWMYLDEIQDELYKQTRKCFSTSLIWYKLRKDIKFSLKVAFERASQWDEEERRDYIFWRDWHLDDNPEMATFLDETHKDRKAARRRRIWSHIGRSAYVDNNFFGGVLDKLYTMLAACDMNGFVFSTCEIVLRDSSTDASTGTIDNTRFEMWVEQRLCPVLGNYIAREPRSLVILDNASIHHSDKVVELIESTGAKVIYTAPFSADLNPIENMFGEYKKGLKRFTPYMSWYEAHFKSLTLVTPKIAKGFFRGCGVQGCESNDDDLDECDTSELHSSVVMSAGLMAITSFRFNHTNNI